MIRDKVPRDHWLLLQQTPVDRSLARKVQIDRAADVHQHFGAEIRSMGVINKGLEQLDADVLAGHRDDLRRTSALVELK